MTKHKYELTVIFRNSTAEESKKNYKEILSKREATVLTEEEWGHKKLAYAIDDQTEAYYLFNVIEADPSAVKKIENDLNLDSNVLRHMFIRLEKSA
ncbi:MAG: 30S ribosomal protein S6 [Spirochaetes bacterium]|nr:30S ribosomal protein S6 [Spirochaetota bacterium]